MKTLTELINENLIFESANVNDWVETLKQYLRDYKNNGGNDYSTSMALYDAMKEDKVLSSLVNPILKSKRSKLQWHSIGEDKHNKDCIEIIFGTLSASFYSPYNFAFRVNYNTAKDQLMINFVNPEYLDWQPKFAKGLKADKYADFVDEFKKSAKKTSPGDFHDDNERSLMVEF
jgi:hypothetical protein